MHLCPGILPLSPSDLYCNTVNLIAFTDLHKKKKKGKSTSSLMPATFCLVHMNADILKFNWEFYVTCRWQETYYSPSNTCRPPRSSSIRPRTPNKRTAWFACIIQHFYVKCLVKSQYFLQQKNNGPNFNGTAGCVPYTAGLCSVVSTELRLLFVFLP